MSSKRLFMTMPEDLYEQFEANREKLGMRVRKTNTTVFRI